MSKSRSLARETSHLIPSQKISDAQTPEPRLTRHAFLQIAATVAASAALRVRGAPPRDVTLDVGINTSSFGRQNRATAADQRIDPFDLPRLMREELNVRVIDLVHTTLATRDHRTLERFRAQATAAGCVITNLKVNEHDLPFDGEKPAARRHALDEYKLWIDAAAVLGARWLRPFPATVAPRWETLLAGYRELAEYAQPRGITLLIENYKWVERQPEVVPRLVRALPGLVAAAPDTGNWPDETTRRRGLGLTFPHAVTADFKVRELGPDDSHPTYDLRASFNIGHQLGFRGPWCIEHVHADRPTLIRELRRIAERLRGWMTSPVKQ